jgi:hypothetical protein
MATTVHVLVLWCGWKRKITSMIRGVYLLPLASVFGDTGNGQYAIVP